MFYRWGQSDFWNIASVTSWEYVCLIKFHRQNSELPNLFSCILGFPQACRLQCCPLCCHCKSWFHKGLWWLCLLPQLTLVWYYKLFIISCENLRLPGVTHVYDNLLDISTYGKNFKEKKLKVFVIIPWYKGNRIVYRKIHKTWYIQLTQFMILSIVISFLSPSSLFFNTVPPLLRNQREEIWGIITCIFLLIECIYTYKRKHYVQVFIYIL